MSLQAINFVLAQETDSAVTRCLLIAIAHHVSNETGACFAGQKLLAEEAGIAERTARAHLEKLETSGFIKRTPRWRSNEGRTSDEIELVGFLDWYAESATLAREGRKARSKPAGDAGNEPGAEPSPAAVDEHGSLPAGDAGGTGTCVPGEENLSVNRTTPLTPQGGNGLELVNEADRPILEGLAKRGEHASGVTRVLAPILTKVRISAADKVAALSALAEAASGLGDEQAASAVRIVLGAVAANPVERIKPARIAEAIDAVRKAGACVVIQPGTAEWRAWAAHDQAAGKRFPWWQRSAPMTMPSRMPPASASSATGGNR